MKNTTRDMCRPIIAQLLEANKGKTEKEIRKALRDGFPWPPRKYHPYKIWLDEINVQMGRRRFNEKKKNPDPKQTNMFDDPYLYFTGPDY